jgi:hypothetical protein
MVTWRSRLTKHTKGSAGVADVVAQEADAHPDGEVVGDVVVDLTSILDVNTRTSSLNASQRKY